MPQAQSACMCNTSNSECNAYYFTLHAIVAQSPLCGQEELRMHSGHITAVELRSRVGHRHCCTARAARPCSRALFSGHVDRQKLHEAGSRKGHFRKLYYGLFSGLARCRMPAAKSRRATSPSPSPSPSPPCYQEYSPRKRAID
jgi:hypothetical protein